MINSLKVLAAALALGLLAACSTPCGAPGRLCASAEPNTSAQGAAPAKVAPGPPLENFRAHRPQSGETPDTTRIALLLPLKSGQLGLPAEALRAGFMAGWERDSKGFTVEVIETGDTADAVLDAYRRAAAGSDIIVGPLARSSVGVVATSRAVSKPTIALSLPGRGVALPPRMLAIGLSVEAEARQAAEWAAREHPNGKALVLTGPAPWQRRAAQAFNARWTELGRNTHIAEIGSSDGYLDAQAIAALRDSMQNDPPDLIFAALDADQLRQARTSFGTSTACYAASPANPGREPGMAVPELDGVHLVDLPWQVQPDHPAVMVYPRWLSDGHTLEMDRLYALGIDAFRIARELALHPDKPVELDGVTGWLSASVGEGKSTFVRRAAAAIYRNGEFEPIARGR